MNEAIGYLFGAAYLLIAAAPLICLFLLVRHYLRGTAIPAGGAAAIYFGCLFWIILIASRAAIVEAWRPWVGMPVVFGTLLGFFWGRRAVPGATIGTAAAQAVVFAFFGFLGWVALGGGYFDRVFQVPYAQNSLRKAGVNADDSAALARALASEDVWVRWGAVLNLARLGPAALPALDAITATLKDPDPRVVHFAWNAIYALGPQAAPAAPAIAARLEDEKSEWNVRRYFEALGPKAEAGVPALLALTENSSPRVRAKALESLGFIGPSAKEAALPVLVRLYKTETDAGVKNAVTDATTKLQIAGPEWQAARSLP